MEMDLATVQFSDLPKVARDLIGDFDDEAGDLTFYRHPVTDVFYMHTHDEHQAWIFDGVTWTSLDEKEFFKIRNSR